MDRAPAAAPRLAVMMFVQFFVWGAWYVAAPLYLKTIGFGARDILWTYSVGPIAGIVSPLFVGLLADRWFPVQRVLGVLHLLGAGAMAIAVVGMQAERPSPDAINLALFGHMLCFFPTLALANAITLRNVGEAQRSFPWIRVFGTIGWIAAGLLVNALALGAAVGMFLLAIGAGVVLGLYAFTLPHTPPLAREQRGSMRSTLGLDALVLLRNRNFAVFLFCSFLMCIPLAFYYQLASRAVVAAGIEDMPATMTYGQMSEILFMVLMPFFFVRLGIKRMLLVAMGAWVVRYVAFAIGTPQEITWLLLTGVVLHGICYDFFFVTGQIYTDRVAPNEIRSQAQGLLVLFTLGLGMLCGAQVAGRIEEQATPAESRVYADRAELLGREIARLRAAEGDQTGRIATLEVEQTTALRESLRRMDWQWIWAVPAVSAAFVMLLFAAVFRRERDDVPDAAADSVATAG